MSKGRQVVIEQASRRARIKVWTNKVIGRIRQSGRRAVDTVYA